MGQGIVGEGVVIDLRPGGGNLILCGRRQSVCTHVSARVCLGVEKRLFMCTDVWVTQR